MDLAVQYMKNGGFNNIDYTELTLAIASGAIGGGTGALIGKMTTSVWWAAAANAEVGAFTGLVSRQIHNAADCKSDSVWKGALACRWGVRCCSWLCRNSSG